MGNIGAKIREGFQTAGNWIHQNVIQPVGAWGKGFINGISGGNWLPLSEEDQQNKWTQAGATSGGILNKIGPSLLKVAGIGV